VLYKTHKQKCVITNSLKCSKQIKVYVQCDGKIQGKFIVSISLAFWGQVILFSVTGNIVSLKGKTQATT